MKRIYALTALALLGTLTANAQDDVALVTDVVATPNYWITVASGVLLAFGFQYLLTALSVAIGVTATPNLKEKYAEAKARDDRREAAIANGNAIIIDEGNDGNNDHNNDDDSTPTGVVVTGALGAWNVVTTALALFTATALAMSLSPVLTDEIALTLGLTIWATFFMLLFWLESRFASTVIGGLVSAATSTLKGTAETIKQIVTPAPAKQIANVAESTIADLHSQFDGAFDTDRIVDAIDNFGKRVEKNTPSYDKLKSDLQDIVGGGSQNGNNGQGGGGGPAKWTAIQSVIQTAIDQSGDSKSKGKDSGGDNGKKKEQLKALMADLKKTYDEEGLTAEGVKKALKDNSPLDDKQVDEYVGKLESVLKGGKSQDFSKENLVQRLQDALGEDGLSVDAVRERVKNMDKKQVAKLVASNTSLDEKQVDNYVDQAMSAFQMLQSKFGSSSSGSDGNSDDGNSAGLTKQLQSRAEGAIKSFVDSTDDSKLDYSLLRKDVQKALANPGDTLTIARKRLATFDKDTLVSVLTNNSKLSREDIDRTVAEVEGARTDFERKLHELETDARRKARQLERQAIIQAEHARESAVSAAWWLVGAIVVSGVAAGLGATLV